MILTIDIGNTNIVLGCIDGDKTLFVERLSTVRTKTELEYAIDIKNVLDIYHIHRDEIEGGIISSVVPQITTIVKLAVEKILKKNVLVVGAGIKTGLNIRIDNPAQLGSDLVVDSVAAIVEYPAPLLIFDLGTANTVCVIDKNKNYIGGMIYPGIGVSLDSLTAHASQLGGISIEAPEHMIGKNTTECMKSGLIYSSAAAMDGIIDRLQEQLGGEATVIATGGLAKKILRREINAVFSDKIIAVSKAVRRSMIAGGTKPQEIAVVYNGIERIPIPSAEEKAALLSSFGGKAGEKAVGMVARLEEVKDHETFLLGAKKLLDKRQDVRFYIVGDGSLRKQLEQKAAALGISEQVTFTGFLQDVEKIEAALDIAVITSKAEALCLSILESMIAGIPAVGTDSGGVAEVILHGENGFLIPVGDSDALAERLDELLTDDATRSAFGAQAKRDAEATFLAEQMTRKIEKLYLEAGK